MNANGSTRNGNTGGSSPLPRVLRQAPENEFCKSGDSLNHAVLTMEQVESWREQGLCLVESGFSRSTSQGHILTDVEAHVFRSAARNAVLGNGTDLEPLPDSKNFGGIGFPFLGRGAEVLNELALHPRIIRAVQELLEMQADDIPMLSQAECWVKCDSQPNRGLPVEYVNTDQRMHCDYPNHYMTHPPAWDQPEAVAMIVYLDDCKDCGGETAYVPRKGPRDEAYRYPYISMPGVANIPWLNDRKSAEEFIAGEDDEMFRFRSMLYEREERVKYRVGTVLMYRLDLWHRGTPLKPNKDRAVVNLLFKRRSAAHITSWHRGWATNSYNSWSVPRVFPPQIGLWEELLSRLAPTQRTCLGFPAVGDAYWTTMTVRAVQQRYPRMNMVAYLAKL